MAYFSPVELSRLMLVRADVTSAISRIMTRFEQRTGYKTYVISGYRFLDQQAATYADSIKGGYRAVPSDESYHPLGAAVDLGIVGQVTSAELDKKNPLYRTLASIGVEEGLDAGFNFKSGKPDPYHFQARETLTDAKTHWQALTRGRLWRLAIIAATLALVTILVRSQSRSR